MIIQPGAIGDCILTLPLAQYMKNALNLGSIVFLGHLDYTGIFAGRTCVDGVKSIESVDLHRLFTSKKLFDLDEWDPLLTAFAPYSWIVTFLGEPDSDFEQNLIYTAHCTHSAEVISLNLKPPADYTNHISRFYIEQFAAAHEPPLSLPEFKPEDLVLRLTENDEPKGAEILSTFEIDAVSEKVIVIAPGSGSIQQMLAD